jgi:hypothetical protein
MRVRCPGNTLDPRPKRERKMIIRLNAQRDRPQHRPAARGVDRDGVGMGWYTVSKNALFCLAIIKVSDKEIAGVANSRRLRMFHAPGDLPQYLVAVRGIDRYVVSAAVRDKEIAGSVKR